jgi:glycyl-tRNA synthetase beta chain
MFAIGLEPTGSKDPFALRRAGNSVIKILTEAKLPFTLGELVIHSSISVPQGPIGTSDKVGIFLQERLEFYLKEVKNFPYDIVKAVLAATLNDPVAVGLTQILGTTATTRYFTGNVQDAFVRAEALNALRGSVDFLAVCAAFKRMKNIITQAKEKGETIRENVITGYFDHPSENELERQAGLVKEVVEKLRAETKYQEGLEQIATLRPHVDLFFDKVMVMVDDPAIRQNRLALIARVLGGFSSIADFSEIVTS